MQEDALAVTDPAGTGQVPDASPEDSWKRATALMPLLIFVALAASIAAVSMEGFRRYRHDVQQAVQRNLLAITDAKVRQFMAWREERHRDAGALVNDQGFRAEFARWANPSRSDPAMEQHFRQRLDSLRQAYGYEDILLFDKSGTRALATRAEALAPSSPGMNRIGHVLRTGGIEYSDIAYLRHDGREHVRLAVVAPIHPPGDDSASPNGAVLLRIDPTRDLFSSLQTWPMPTSSGETFLAKHEGDTITYLSELRQPNGRDMAMRFPVSEKKLLAAQAARGSEGLLEGEDYRGVASVGAARLIPDTSWLIVSKIDREEIDAPIRHTGWIVSIVTLLFMAIAAAATVMWWRNQHSMMLAGVYRMRLMHEATQQRLENFTRYANDIILLIDEQAHIVEANERAVEAYGYSLDSLQGEHASMLRDPGYLHSFENDVRSGDIQGCVYETMHRHRDGRSFPVEVSMRLIELDGRQLRLAIIRDISERKQAEARIDRLAHQDALTGLLNRYSLQSRLEQALATSRREQAALAVMFLDMDHFKSINDTLGHAIGDRVLIEAAGRLRDSVRESDIVARLGGDEYVVVLTEVEDATAAARVADKILRSLSQPYAIDEEVLHVTSSIGLAVFPSDGDDGDTLMRNADTAMYHAKAQGRNNAQFFAAEMNRAAVERLHLDHDLHLALAQNQFELHYQPQLDTHCGRVVGVEALVRWNHPRDGLVAPAGFIPVAEENGLILPLGEWVLDEACRQLRAWRDEGVADFTVAVNLSAHQLRAPNLPAFVADTLRKHGLKGGDLELEITESVAMSNPDASIGRLNQLRSLGVRLSMDDFGTGYSSLSYLKLLPIDTLKLDRSFVRDIEVDDNDVAICTATIALAHNLGLKVVAEGVENTAQRTLLEAHRCDFLQGYLFSSPMIAAAVPEFIRANATSRE